MLPCGRLDGGIMSIPTAAPLLQVRPVIGMDSGQKGL